MIFIQTPEFRIRKIYEITNTAPRLKQDQVLPQPRSGEGSVILRLNKPLEQNPVTTNTSNITTFPFILKMKLCFSERCFRMIISLHKSDGSKNYICPPGSSYFSSQITTTLDHHLLPGFLDSYLPLSNTVQSILY